MSCSNLNILFVLRADAAVKGGGDIVQAKFYKQVLEGAFNCRVLFFHEIEMERVRLVEWDVVQLFNVSRLHENFMLLAGVRYKKILLSPILQPGFSFGFNVLVKNILRSLLRGRISLGAFLKSPVDLLQRFDGLVFLSAAERDAYFKRFPGVVSRSVIYANGVDDGLAPGAGERIFDFIVVGRIEPKKRVSEAIDVVSIAAPQSLLVCVGGVNWYHPFYALRFFYKVFCGEVIYLGRRSSAVVYDFMRRTKVLLNFSELEVSPLVDLEALACGCKVLSTIYSYSHLSDGDQFERIDVKDDVVCVDAVRRALVYSAGAGAGAGAGAVVHTWAENSSAYLEMVRGLIGEK